MKYSSDNFQFMFTYYFTIKVLQLYDEPGIIQK